MSHYWLPRLCAWWSSAGQDVWPVSSPTCRRTFSLFFPSFFWIISLVPFFLLLNHISILGTVKYQSNLGDIRQLRIYILPRGFLWICTDSTVCAFALVLQDGTSLFLWKSKDNQHQQWHTDKFMYKCIFPFSSFHILQLPFPPDSIATSLKR